MLEQLLIITLLILLFVVFVRSGFKNLDHWKNKRIKYIKPLPFVGNFLATVTNKTSVAELINSFYRSFPHERYVGFYKLKTPILLINDPELIKCITIKHFEHFIDHSSFFSDDDPLWNRNLFVSTGERWKDLRSTLSPAFTGSKMRIMFPLIKNCSAQFLDYFTKQDSELIEVDLKDSFSRYANNVIASTAFGIEVDAMKHKNDEFYLLGKELTDFSGLKKCKLLIFETYPLLAKFLKLRFLTERVAKFFRNIVEETIKMRQQNKIIRHDLIHLLMLSRSAKLKHEDDDLPKAGFSAVEETELGKNRSFLSNEDITAQAILFFFGGYDTTSTLLSFVGYELAVNPTVQDKLREEIAEVYQRKKDDITYEEISQMKYLDMVISEALRKWPQSIFLDRICTKKFELPEEKLKLDVGDICWIPVYAIHRDEKYYPNPEKFDPERFHPNNIDKIQSGTYMPFGLGPRNCIGSRFALLEAKIVFYYILAQFEIVPVGKTQIPMKLCKRNAFLAPENGFYVGLKRR